MQLKLEEEGLNMNASFEHLGKSKKYQEIVF